MGGGGRQQERGFVAAESAGTQLGSERHTHTHSLTHRERRKERTKGTKTRREGKANTKERIRKVPQGEKVRLGVTIERTIKSNEGFTNERTNDQIFTFVQPSLILLPFFPFPTFPAHTLLSFSFPYNPLWIYTAPL